jgi:hypothetical protein
MIAFHDDKDAVVVAVTKEIAGEKEQRAAREIVTAGVATPHERLPTGPLLEEEIFIYRPFLVLTTCETNPNL